MEYKSRFYPESRYGGFTDIDSTIHFYLRVNALLTGSSIVLDVGCGRGQYAGDPLGIRRELQVLQNRAASVIGIDIDPRAKKNPFLDVFQLISAGEPWPVDSASIDLCVCDWTLEHIEDPEHFFSESWRVLAPGGVLCIRTSNLLHYRSLAAAIIPERYHRSILKVAQRGTWRKEEDVFPARYRCNTRRKIRRIQKRHGFSDIVVYGFHSEPAYLAFSNLAYLIGKMYQQLLPDVFAPMIFSFSRK